VERNALAEGVTDAQAPKDRTRHASFALHASAVLYGLVAAVIALVPLGWDPAATPEYALRAGVLWGLAGFTVGLAIFVEVIVAGLKRRRRWALVAANVMFVLYVFSAFLPLGVLGLIGTLSAGTRAQFSLPPRSDTVRRAR